MTMTTILFDFFGEPTKQQNLMRTADNLEQFFEQRKLAVPEKSRELVIDLMETVTSDMSGVHASTIAWWSNESKVNDRFDLTCQCSRIGKLLKYDYVLWEYKKPDEDPIDAHHISRWFDEVKDPN